MFKTKTEMVGLDKNIIGYEGITVMFSNGTLTFFVFFVFKIQACHCCFATQYRGCLEAIRQHTLAQKPVVCSVLYCGDSTHFNYGHRMIVNSLIRSGVYVFTPTDFLPSSSFPQYRREINLLIKDGDRRFEAHMSELLNKTDFVIPIIGHKSKDDLSKIIQNFSPDKVTGFFLSPQSNLYANEFCEGKPFYRCSNRHGHYEIITGINIIDLLRIILNTRSNKSLEKCLDCFMEFYNIKPQCFRYSYLEHFPDLPPGTVEKNLWYDVDIEERKYLTRIFNTPLSKEILSI